MITDDITSGAYDADLDQLAAAIAARRQVVPKRDWQVFYGTPSLPTIERVSEAIPYGAAADAAERVRGFVSVVTELREDIDYAVGDAPCAHVFVSTSAGLIELDYADLRDAAARKNT